MPDPDQGGIAIRPYEAHDAPATLEVFTQSVLRTAARDYSPAQLDAWAQPGQRDPAEWNAKMLARNTFVAVEGSSGMVVGFSDVDGHGYIDMMFVDPGATRRGIGTLLLIHAEELARAAGATELLADVSITARPFFEAHGFAVENVNHPVVGGVEFTNYRMSRPLT